MQKRRVLVWPAMRKKIPRFEMVPNFAMVSNFGIVPRIEMVLSLSEWFRNWFKIITKPVQHYYEAGFASVEMVPKKVVVTTNLDWEQD